MKERTKTRHIPFHLFPFGVRGVEKVLGPVVIAWGFFVGKRVREGSRESTGTMSRKKKTSTKLQVLLGGR
mgnify:CR=1 FL=1